MKIFLEEKKGLKEKKVMYSTSLPENLNRSLEGAVRALGRKKADWVRGALLLFLSLSEKEQEREILRTYKELEKSRPKPFTTTLFESQLSQLEQVSKKLKRSKAEIIRSAVYHFLSLSGTDQEGWIKKTISG
jgi:predicted DNA-binding protein